MGLFSSIPYHFPSFRSLGQWEWSEKHQSWTLNLSRNAHGLLGFGVARAFSQFNDDRLEFNGAMDFANNEFLGGWITIKGRDGRSYFAERLDIHWRVFMHNGKRIAKECPRPYDIDKIPFVVTTDD